MGDVPDRGQGPWEWALATRALTGEEEPGDKALIKPLGQRTLVAVVDGLGHGQAAVAAARLAIRTLEEHAQEDLAELVGRCHVALRDTRGAVISLGSAHNDGRLTWMGVGNVEAVLVRTDATGQRSHEHPLLLGGVVGMRVPLLRPSQTMVAPGDRLIFATDGISRFFVEDLSAGPPQRTADDILQRYATGHDDALVVVGQYRKGWS